MSRYAIIEAGSKQYRVEPDAIINVELIKDKQSGDKVTLENVLLFKDGDRIEIGTPSVKGAQVVCEHLGEAKGPKVISFKYRRRKASKNKKGHRQKYSRLLVKEIKI